MSMQVNRSTGQQVSVPSGQEGVVTGGVVTGAPPLGGGSTRLPVCMSMCGPLRLRVRCSDMVLINLGGAGSRGLPLVDECVRRRTGMEGFAAAGVLAWRRAVTTTGFVWFGVHGRMPVSSYGSADLTP